VDSGRPQSQEGCWPVAIFSSLPQGSIRHGSLFIWVNTWQAQGQVFSCLILQVMSHHSCILCSLGLEKANVNFSLFYLC
jgi:hypothetical protein